MPLSTEDASATATPESVSTATPASESAPSSTSDAGTNVVAQVAQQATQPDAIPASSLKSPIQRSEPPDSIVASQHRPTPQTAPQIAAQTQTTAQPPVQQQPVDWQKRFNDTQPFLTKLQQENQQFRQELKQWDGLDPQHIKQQQQLQQQQAQLASLKPWNRDHPEHTRFRGVRDRLKAQYELANELPPETREQAIRAINGRVSDSDRKALEEYRAYQEQEAAMTPEERDDRYREMASQVFSAKLAEYEQFQSTKQSTQQFLQSNAEFLDKHRDVVMWGMNHPARREVGVRLAQLEAENEQLRHKATSETQEVETARARDAITKQRATVRRDASTTGVADPSAEATKLGLRGEAAFDYIARHHRSQQ